MRKLFDSSKTKTAYSLYLIGFALLYFLFLFFELRKGQYINTYSLENTINADQFSYLNGISKITTNIEYMMTVLFLAGLVGAVLHKSRDLAAFITINYVLILVLFLLGYLLSISSSTPIGNNTQALISPFTMTGLVLVLYAAFRFKKRLSRKS